MTEKPPDRERNERKQKQFQLSIFGTEPKRTNKAATTDASKDEKENDKSMNIHALYDRLFARKAGAWTAIFTFVLAIFSYLLWQVSKDANNTSAATQAASLSSFGPAMLKVPSADGKTLRGYNIFFTWVNNGTTPTKSTTMQANVSVGPATPTKGLDFSTLPQAQILTAVLGPKAGIQMTPTFVSLEDFEDVQQGRKHMFFWGWAVYHDVFSDAARLSEYCFDVQGANWTKPDHTDPTGDVTLSNPPCGVHFCFNEECEDYKTRTK